MSNWLKWKRPNTSYITRSRLPNMFPQTNVIRTISDSSTLLVIYHQAELRWHYNPGLIIIIPLTILVYASLGSRWISRDPNMGYISGTHYTSEVRCRITNVVYIKMKFIICSENWGKSVWFYLAKQKRDCTSVVMKYFNPCREKSFESTYEGRAISYPSFVELEEHVTPMNTLFITCDRTKLKIYCELQVSTWGIVWTLYLPLRQIADSECLGLFTTARTGLVINPKNRLFINAGIVFRVLTTKIVEFETWNTISAYVMNCCGTIIQF